MNPLADPDAFLRLAEQYAALGIAHIHLRTATDDPAGYVARFGELVAPRMDADPDRDRRVTLTDWSQCR